MTPEPKTPTKVTTFECHTGNHGSPPCPGKAWFHRALVQCGCDCHHPEES